MFNFERYISQIQSNLSKGGAYRIWGVKIKRLQFIDQTTLRCIYVNMRPEIDLNAGVFRFIEHDDKNNRPAIQRQAVFDVSTPGKLGITTDDNATVIVTSIRQLHGVLSVPVPP